MQAWGTSSRFAYRSTDPVPSKSAVLGLLAAAEGRRRSDPIEDLLQLRFGVRSDQPGRVIRDFQTARALDESYALPLTYRFYLADATFVVGVEGERGFIDSLAAALCRPAFPLFLGRRSCPPARPLLIGVSDVPLQAALEAQPWEAARWYRRGKPGQVELELVLDAGADSRVDDTVQDAPVSFDPHHRQFGLRGVVHRTCLVANPEAERRVDDGGDDVRVSVAVGAGRGGDRSRRGSRATTHDPMGWWQAR